MYMAPRGMKQGLKVNEKVIEILAVCRLIKIQFCVHINVFYMNELLAFISSDLLALAN